MKKQILLTIKKNSLLVSNVLLTLLFTVGIVKMLEIRFNNPDLTETRLLIEFGWEYAKIVGLLVIGANLHWRLVRREKVKA